MNGVIFYHEAGSCGDFVCGLLQKTKEFFCYSKFDQIDENGMVLPHKAKDNISTLFPEPNKELGLWATRDWIDYDQSKIDALIEKENKIFIINIMTMTQYKSLREKNCNYPLVGINVEGQLDYFVKKCVLLKLKDFESWKDSAKQYGHVAEYIIFYSTLSISFSIHSISLAVYSILFHILLIEIEKNYMVHQLKRLQ